MNNKIYKIGQEIIVKENFKINNTRSDKVVTVKEGDRGFLDSKGFLNITTGKGRGKFVKIDDIEVKGYDHINISKMIFNRLNSEYELDNFLEYEGIRRSELINDIADVLSDILYII